VVDAGPPDATRSAGERAVVDQLDALVAVGHEVEFVALGLDPRQTPSVAERVHADLVGRGVQVRPGDGVGDGVAPLLAADVLVVHRPGPALRLAPLLAAHPTLPVVYAGHDLHAERLTAAADRLGGDRRPARVVAVAERTAWRTADVVTYPTAREAAVVRARTGHAGVLAVPYYRLTDDDLVPEHAGDVGPRRGLLMVGGAAHAPNRDAVAHVVAEVLGPLRAAGIDDPVTVVGDWPRDARAGLEPAVAFTGQVDEATLARLHRSHRLLLAPLRFGAGAKRKLVGAMAAGLPVVTSGVGADGLLVRDAGPADGISVADDPEAVVRAVAALADPAVAAAGATRARRVVTEVYGTVPYDHGVAATLFAAVDGRRRRN